jgi:hypothetical protein
MGADNQAQIWAVLGASGSGKGLWIKGELRRLKPPRLLIFDQMDEYGEFAKPAASLQALLGELKATGSGKPGKWRYVPRGAAAKAVKLEFEAFCSLVYAWGNCTFVAEELANVTSPGYAPPAWRRMTTSGRHAGIHVIGTSQTPALIDKTFLGNATLIHCGPLREASHRQTVARSMDVPVDDLAKIQPLEWIEKRWSTGEVAKGVVKIPKKRT